MNVTIILWGIRKSGNLGAICRVAKNFGFGNIVLVDPRCNKDSIEAKKRAKHAQDVLQNVKVKSWRCLSKFDYLVGTTSKLGTDYNIPRSPIDVEGLCSKVKCKKNKIAVVFGNEGDGLNNGQLGRCDFVVSIPSSKKYPTLNLSHAVAIILYELCKGNKGKVADHIISANKNDKDQLMKLLKFSLGKMDFATNEKIETQKVVWKRLIGKSFMTKREAFALMGFLRKIK